MAFFPSNLGNTFFKKILKVSKHMLSHHNVSVNEKLSKDICAVRSYSNRSRTSLSCAVHVLHGMSLSTRAVLIHSVAL